MNLTITIPKGIVCDGQPRLLIKKRGEIFLGDRWDGELNMKGNSIFVGKDTGSQANGDGKNHMLQINLAR